MGTRATWTAAVPSTPGNSERFLLILLLDEQLELAERHVPLAPDEVQRMAGLLQPSTLQLPEALLSPPAPANQPGAGVSVLRR